MPMTAPVLTPPLREGDRLTPEEFLRRWDAMPDVKHAELIDGIVHMSSPLSNIHGVLDQRMSAWLSFYTLVTPGCQVVSDVTWLMSAESVPQPDIAMRVEGLHSHIEEKYPSAPPELIVEISHTTFAKDSGPKLRLYERSGVREYLIVRPEKRQAIWRELVDGRYREIDPDIDGLLRSRVFPGLWLDPETIWNYDPAAVFAVIQRGAAEHH